MPARMALTTIDDVRRHLRRAVHLMIESGQPEYFDRRTGCVLPGALADALKVLAAGKSGLRATWAHGDEVTRIVDAVIATRESRDRRHAGGRR